MPGRARAHARRAQPLVPQVFAPDQDGCVPVAQALLDRHVHLADVLLIHRVYREDAVLRVGEHALPALLRSVVQLLRVVPEMRGVPVRVPAEPALRHFLVFQPAPYSPHVLSGHVFQSDCCMWHRVSSCAGRVLPGVTVLYPRRRRPSRTGSLSLPMPMADNVLHSHGPSAGGLRMNGGLM